MTSEPAHTEGIDKERFESMWSSQAEIMNRDGIAGVCRTVGLGCGLVAQWRMTEEEFTQHGLRSKNLPRRAVLAMRATRQTAVDNAAAIWFAAYSLQIAKRHDPDGWAGIDAEELAAVKRLLPALSVMIWNVVGDEWLDDPYSNTPQSVRQLILQMASLGDSGPEIAAALEAQPQA